MSAEWKEFKFGELCDISRGASPRPIKDFISDVGMPWVKIADATSSNSKFISETREKIKVEGVCKSVVVHPGDLILSNSATPGLPRFMSIKACIHDGWMLLKNFRGLDKGFAYWLLLYERKKLVAQGNGSVFTNLKTDILRNHLVRIPNIGYQRAITRILNSIDGKIELNNKINQTLEQMAQSIFKSWFVDFEPVRAKIEAKKRWQALQAGNEPASPVCYAEPEPLPDLETYMNLAAMQAISGKSPEQLARMEREQPEQYARLRATAELFPSAMQPSELGEIPEGWKESTVGKEFDVTMGQSPPGDTYNESGEGVPFFQGRRDFGDRFPSNRVYCTSPKRMAKDGDTLLSVRAPVGDTNIALGDCCIGRGLAAIRHKSGCPHFTYYSIIHLGRELSSFDSEGTVFGSINKNNLQSIPVIAPATDVLSVFQRIVGKIDERIRANFMETISLKCLRDTLLPKLLSGEITVPEAEAQLAKTGEAQA